MTHTVEIVKANGEREVFSEKKLRASLRRARARKDLIDRVVAQIVHDIRPNMTTRDIYERAFSLLKKERRGAAARYNLGNAIMALGPNGFPFECLIGEIFRADGYEVEVGIQDRGWCTTHEIDVSARKDGNHVLAECKFHNQHGVKSDLKVALYVHARFQDLERWHEHTRPEKSRFHEAWLITNTKLTSHAIEYGECAGLRMLAWNYPKRGSLRDRIIETGVLPITLLESLTKRELRALLDAKIVSFRQFAESRELVTRTGIRVERIERALREMDSIKENGHAH